jgi:hypothetical protein
MTAYAASSDAWESFRQEGQKESLYEVAAILCGAWTALSEDDDFFEAMSQMTEERMEPDLQNAIRGDFSPGDDPDRARVLTDLAANREVDKLLAQELVVLIRAGMEPLHSVRLVSDLSGLLSGDLEPLALRDMQELRQQVPVLASELCKAQRVLKVFDYEAAREAAIERAPHKRWVKTLRLLGGSLGATAGAAGAVGNVAAAVASFGFLTGLSLASVLAGGAAIAKAVGEALESEVGVPPAAGQRRRSSRPPTSA